MSGSGVFRRARANAGGDCRNTGEGEQAAVKETPMTNPNASPLLALRESPYLSIMICSGTARGYRDENNFEPIRSQVYNVD